MVPKANIALSVRRAILLLLISLTFKRIRSVVDSRGMLRIAAVPNWIFSRSNKSESDGLGWESCSGTEVLLGAEGSIEIGSLAGGKAASSIPVSAVWVCAAAITCMSLEFQA
jgi:hypothetical protein